MTRLVLGGVAAAILLLLPATAQGDSAARVRGTVALKDTPNHVVTVRSVRKAFGLDVPGSLALIRVGQRVELRGSILRQRGHGSRVLARNVTIATVRPLSTAAGDDDEADEDEVEITGTLTSLSPVTVTSPSKTVVCTNPAGVSLTGFAVGDVVEITCDLKAGVWVLRKLEHEDADEDEADEDDRGVNSGPGNVDEDDHDHSGPGGGGDDDGHGDSSGPGGGGDD